MATLENVMRWNDLVRETLSNTHYNGINGFLVLALIWQESGGNPWAWNPEPHYRWLWDVSKNAPFRKMTAGEIASERPPSDFPYLAGDRDQEWWAQQVSWGLIQIMGAAARECGFKGPYLTELCDPAINLEYGVHHLWRYCFKNGQLTTEQALARWNINPSYPGEVMEKLVEVERRSS